MTKKDLKKYIEEYQDLLDKRRQDNYVGKVSKTNKKVRKTPVMPKDDKPTFSENSMLSGIRTLRTQFNDVLGQLERQFQDHFHYYIDLKKNIDSEKQTLEEIYQIRYSIDTISKLNTQIDSQKNFLESIGSKKLEWENDQKAIQEKLYEKEKELQFFQIDMDEKKKSLLLDYEQKENELRQELKERRLLFEKELEEKSHQHDQKMLHIHQVQKEQILSDQKDNEKTRLELEKEHDNKRLAFEKEILEREANFSEKEMELAQLRTKALSFPKELVDSLKKKEKEVTERLVLKYSHIIELNKKGHEADIKLYQHKLSMSEKKVLEQKSIINSLKEKLLLKNAGVSVEKKLKKPLQDSSKRSSKTFSQNIGEELLDKPKILRVNKRRV